MSTTRIIALSLCTLVTAVGCNDDEPAADVSAAGDDVASEAAPEAAGSLEEIPACAAYFSAFRACHGADNPSVKGMVKGFQNQLDRGTSPSIIAKACANGNEKFTCRKGASKTASKAADDVETASPREPLRKGIAAAYDLDGTLIAEARCTRRGRSFDYVGCGKSVRAQAKAELCKRGKGTHEYVYRSGTKRERSAKVFCR